MKLTVIHMSRTMMDGLLFTVSAGESLNISCCNTMSSYNTLKMCGSPQVQFSISILKLKFQFWNSTNCILAFYRALQFYHPLSKHMRYLHTSYARGTALGPLASQHCSMCLLHQWSVCNQMYIGLVYSPRP